MLRRLAQQLEEIVASLIWTAAVACAALMLVLAFHLHGVAVEFLTQDPLAVAELPPYTGMVSQLGLLFWAAAFTLVVQAAATRARGSTERRYLLVFAALTLGLALDDAFMVHEGILPHLQIGEAVTYVLYVVLLVLMIAGHWRTFWQTDFLLILAALGAFAFSAVLDLLVLPTSLSFLLEDGAKFVGILLWTSYSWRLALGNRTQPVAEQNMRPAAEAQAVGDRSLITRHSELHGDANYGGLMGAPEAARPTHPN